mgnify:CR=1 FL=1
MDILILGFYSDMNRHSLKDVYLYLLVFGILNLLMGRYLERRKEDLSYLWLIRFGRVSLWWHRLAKKVLVLMLSLSVMISICHAVVRLPGYLSWNVPFDGAAIRPIMKGLSSYIHALPAL